MSESKPRHLYPGSGIWPAPETDPARLAAKISREGVPSRWDPTAGKWRYGEAPKPRERLPIKAPPPPTNAQIIEAHAEKMAYFRWLNAHQRGEDLPKPLPPKLPQYWDLPAA